MHDLRWAMGHKEDSETLSYMIAQFESGSDQESLAKLLHDTTSPQAIQEATEALSRLLKVPRTKILAVKANDRAKYLTNLKHFDKKPEQVLVFINALSWHNLEDDFEKNPILNGVRGFFFFFGEDGGQFQMSGDRLTFTVWDRFELRMIDETTLQEVDSADELFEQTPISSRLFDQSSELSRDLTIEFFRHLLDGTSYEESFRKLQGAQE